MVRGSGEPQRSRETLAMYLAVAIGAAIGGVLRAGLSMALLAQFGVGFPVGTLAANVIGSFVIGAYAALTGPDGRLLVSSRQRQFVMTGICGGRRQAQRSSPSGRRACRSSRSSSARSPSPDCPADRPL